jgi:cohesin loading factor subunit SCC2
LERSIIYGEDINPFAGPVVKLTDGAAASAGDDNNSKSPAKGKKGKNIKTPEGRQTRSKSRTPVEPDAMDEDEDKSVDSEKVEHALDLAKESVLAADACLALLGSDQLPKQVGPIDSQGLSILTHNLL